MKEYPIDLIRHKGAVERMQCGKKRLVVVNELRELINRNSLENDSNTPDFVIAAYLFDCLVNWNMTVGQRCYWYNPEGENE